MCALCPDILRVDLGPDYPVLEGRPTAATSSPINPSIQSTSTSRCRRAFRMMRRFPAVVSGCQVHPACWSRTWAQNTAKSIRTTATQCNKLDGSTSLTCSYETDRTGGDRDRLAHNPEVAGSNPVPATRQNGPRRTLRGPFSCRLGTLLGTFATLTIRPIQHPAGRSPGNAAAPPSRWRLSRCRAGVYAVWLRTLYP
jgi:hypothetical protein